MTRKEFTTYMIDVKGYSIDDVKDIISEMATSDTPIQEYLSSEELEEAREYTK